MDHDLGTILPSSLPVIGFVGCGQMGQPIARQLLQAGYHLWVYDVDPEQSACLEAFDARARAVESPEAAALPGGIVVSMVPDDQALRTITLGSHGILNALGTGGIHLSLSTVSPALSAELAARYAQQGCAFVAATVSGRPDVAASGRLSVYVAGDDSAKGQVHPLLEAIGQHCYDLGSNVAAPNVVKLAANYLIVANLVILSAAATFVERHGIDRAWFLRAMADSPLFGGAVFEQYGAEMIGHRDYHDAKFPVARGLKDVNLILDEAKQMDHVLPGADLAHQALTLACAFGSLESDWSSLAEFVQNAARQLARVRHETAVSESIPVSIEPVIAIKQVSKSFGTFPALMGVSLRINPGEIFGLLGPNGAGKTTIMNMLSGLSTPTSGEIRVLGYDVRRDARQIRRLLGVVPQKTALYEELTAWDNLLFHAELFGLPRRDQKRRIMAMLELVQLVERRYSRVKTFSGGMKRRLELARALLHDPQIIYLDEPTLGVDVQSRHALWDHIRRLRDQGKTIVLTTNYLEEAEQLCDRLAILDHGAVLTVETPARLRQQYGSQVITLETEQPYTALAQIKALSGVTQVEREGCRLTVTTRGEKNALPQLVSLVGRERALRSLDIQEASLNEVFVALTGTRLRDDESGRNA